MTKKTKEVKTNDKVEPKKVGLMTVLGWVFGIMFILGGIGNLMLSTMTGLFFILAGITILPLTNNLLQKHMNITLGRGLRIFIAFIFIILAVVVTGNEVNTNNNLDTSNVKSSTDYTSQNSNIENEVNSDNIKTTEVETPSTIKTSNEKIYSINENINVDYLTYKVLKVEEFAKMGNSMFEKETNGKLIKVYLEILNNAKETKQIFTPRFKIEDNQGRKYDRLSDDMMYIADHIEFGIQLQPGLATEGAIVFEMPTNSEDLHLLVNGDWTSISEVKVKLDKINNIGVDTTLQDEQDEMMDEIYEQAEEDMEELMNKCNAPFKCSSSCGEYMDIGQKDCSSGQVCCME